MTLPLFRTPVAVLALLLVGGLAFSGDNRPATNEASAAASEARLKHDIFYLAGPECEGRVTGSAGFDKAADFVAAEFQKAGLKPAGVNGTWFQPYDAFARRPGRLGTENGVTFWGPKNTKTVLAAEDFQVFGGSPAAKVAGGVVFVGHGVSLKGVRDDYAGLDVAGKTVVVLRGVPSGLSDEQGQKAASFSGKMAAAVEHKAAAVVFVNDTAIAGTTDRLPAFRETPGAAAAIPAVFIKRATLDEFLPDGKKVKDLEAAAGFALTGWTVTLETDVTRQSVPAKNVIGVLEGAGPLADETVVVGAHLDHLGVGAKFGGSLERDVEKRKTTHWGADDNGSGSTCVVELARRFGAMKDRQGRRIVFMCFSGEEMGLYGSQFYCQDQPLFPIKSTVAMVNLDMVGRLRKAPDSTLDALEVGGTGTAKTFDALIETLAKKHEMTLVKKPGGRGPSDHQSFFEVGVPVFFFFTGYHGEYHRPADVPELVNVPGMRKVVDLSVDVLTELTTVKDRPEYVKASGGGNPNMFLGGGSGSRPSLNIRPNYDESQDGGVLVDSVTPGGAAEKAGVKKGDRIVAIAGTPVKNLTAYMAEMGKLKAGKEVEVEVMRDGKKMTLKVTPAAPQ